MSDKEKLKKNLELKQALEDLVSADDDKKISMGDSQEISDIKNTPRLYTDFNELSSNAREESKKIVASIIKFYLDLEIISKDEYVEKKKLLQERSLSAVLFSMETSEYVCIKLLEEIDAGNANLKAFEVFAKIQDTLMRAVELQQNSIDKLEDQWKKYRMDSEELKVYKIHENGEEPIEGQDLRIKGSRKLVEIAQRISEEKGINKSEPHEVTADPREAHMESLKIKEEDPNNKVDDALFN